MKEQLIKLLEADRVALESEFAGSPPHAFITGKIYAYEKVLELLEHDDSLAWLSQALNEGKGVYKP